MRYAPPKKYRVMSAAEVAAEMDITQSGVDKLEQYAIEKLRRNPVLRRLWNELGEARRSNNVGTAEI
jgi:DNA-directed RNA polymerase sigma subunit (sigma70/sigma32)